MSRYVPPSPEQVAEWEEALARDLREYAEEWGDDLDGAHPLWVEEGGEVIGSLGPHHLWWRIARGTHSGTEHAREWWAENGDRIMAAARGC